jgi:hypothetical protein
VYNLLKNAGILILMKLKPLPFHYVRGKKFRMTEVVLVNMQAVSGSWTVGSNISMKSGVI